jgi:AcrR family transcriptional regulator
VERLLDAAERLFGERGYDGVGLRELTEAARVNLGAATYHFGSKEALYVQTFLRRFRPTDAERLRLLREAELAANGAPLPVETVVTCMIRPPFMMMFDHPAFHALMARSLFMPPPFLLAALHREAEPHNEVFVTALARSLPALPEPLLRLRSRFAMGTLLGLSVEVHLAGRAHGPKFTEATLGELVRFIGAGLRQQP